MTLKIRRQHGSNPPGGNEYKKDFDGFCESPIDTKDAKVQTQDGSFDEADDHRIDAFIPVSEDCEGFEAFRRPVRLGVFSSPILERCCRTSLAARLSNEIGRTYCSAERRS